MQEQAFRIILVAKYEVSVFREEASKIRGKRGPKMTSKSSFGSSGVIFLGFFERLFEKSDC